MLEGRVAYAFISHWSALEALRVLEGERPTWPRKPRLLPVFGECVRNQRMFRETCPPSDLMAWGIRERPVDLLVPHENMRSRGKSARFHVWKWPIPRQAMLHLSDNVLVSKPSFVVMQMAGYHHKVMPLADEFGHQLRAERDVLDRAGINERPLFDNPITWDLTVRLVELTKVICELLGTYRLGTGGASTQYGMQPLMDRSDVREMLDELPGLYGLNRVHQALGFAYDMSASPMETALALMLTLPPQVGGFGLPRPRLNVALGVKDPKVVHAGCDEVYPDLYWPSARLVLEYESFEFHVAMGGRKLPDDAARANALAAQQYVVLRATDETMRSLGELDLLARQIATVLEVELPEIDAVGRLRRERLHALLLR